MAPTFAEAVTDLLKAQITTLQSVPLAPWQSLVAERLSPLSQQCQVEEATRAAVHPCPVLHLRPDGHVPENHRNDVSHQHVNGQPAWMIVGAKPYTDTLAMKPATIASPAILTARGMSCVSIITAALDLVSPKMRNPE